MADDLDKVLERIEKLDERLERKLGAVEDRLLSIDKTLVKQEENLKEHMRRTELAEKSIERVDHDLKPIKKHVAMLQGTVKLISIVSTIVVLIGAILKIYGVM